MGKPLTGSRPTLIVGGPTRDPKPEACARPRVDQMVGIDGGSAPARSWALPGCSWLWLAENATTPVQRVRMDGLLLWWSDLRDPLAVLKRVRPICDQRNVPLVVAAEPEALPTVGVLEEGLVDAVVDPDWPPEFILRCIRLAARSAAETSNILEIQSEVLRAARDEVADLYDKSVVDPLTGLFNLGHLRASLPRVHQEAARAERPYTVIFADVDDLKSVNTRYGHANGSRLVSEVGKTVKACLGRDDLAFRYGGDEFVLLLPGADAEAGCNFGGRLLSRLRNRRLAIGGDQLRLTLTLGLATHPRDGADADELLSRADAAMRAAKAAGKNRAGCFSPQPCTQWLDPGVNAQPVCPVKLPS